MFARIHLKFGVGELTTFSTCIERPLPKIYCHIALFNNYSTIFTGPEENNCFSIIIQVIIRVTAFSLILFESSKTSTNRTAAILKIRTSVQWNLDLTKSLGTGQICSLNGGFVISRFFSIHFTVTLAGT